MNGTPIRTPSSWWTLGALATIVLATTTPQPGFGGSPDFFAPPQPDRLDAFRDAVQNVLLYLPFGLLFALRVGGRAAVAAAAGVSLAIELLQFVVPGRDPVALDVVTNTCGGALGWAVSRTAGGRWIANRLIAIEALFVAARDPSPRLASALSLGWAVCVCTMVTATYWLLSPALTPPFFFGVVSPSVDEAPGPARAGGGGFVGLIDEVRVYARALSAEEIAEDMGQPASVSPGPALVAAYGFDSVEESVSTQPAEGRFGGALVLDGRQTGVTLADVAGDLTGAMTFEAWVRPDGPPRGEAAVVSLPDDVFYLRASSDVGVLVPSAGGRFGAVPRFVRTRRPIPEGRWTHLASTYDGQTLSVYVDGRLSATRVLWSSHRPVAAALDGRDLPFGAVADPIAFRRTLMEPFTLRVTVACGPGTDAVAPVLLVTGLQSIDALALEASGSELRVRYQTRAHQLGFGSASHRFPGALSACQPGRTASLVVRGPLQNPRVEKPDGVAIAGIGPGAGSIWTIAVDSHLLPPWLVAALSALWLGIAVLPFGYWLRLSAATGVGAALLASVLLASPRLWDVRGLSVEESWAVVLGLTVGVVASSLRRRTGQRRPIATSRGGPAPS